MDLLYPSNAMVYTMPIVFFMTKVETNMLSWMDFTDTQLCFVTRTFLSVKTECYRYSIEKEDISDENGIHHSTQPSERKTRELQASLVGMLKLGWDEIKIMKSLE
jgi:hypothetical protein